MRLRWLAVPLAAAAIAPAPAAAQEHAPACHWDPNSSADARPSPLTGLFNAYGDDNTRLDDWTGADNTASVQLPDGRTAWVFADTFLDAVNPDHSRNEDDFIQNSIVTQRGWRLLDTIHGGTAAHPETLIQTDDGRQADGKEEVGDTWYWANGAFLDGGKLRVFANKYEMYSNDVFGFRWLDNRVATFSLPGLRLESITKLPSDANITWGSSTIKHGRWTYVYGNGANSLYAARVQRERLTHAPWQYWTGSGWSAQETDAAPLLHGIGTATGVQRIGGAYVLVTFDNRSFLPADIVAYAACSPTGPWNGPVELYHAPEAGGNHFVYDARTHPQFNRDGRITVSYNVNSFDFQDLMDDVRVYRPRFIEVRLPRLVP